MNLYTETVYDNEDNASFGLFNAVNKPAIHAAIKIIWRNVIICITKTKLFYKWMGNLHAPCYTSPCLAMKVEKLNHRLSVFFCFFLIKDALDSEKIFRITQMINDYLILEYKKMFKVAKKT